MRTLKHSVDTDRRFFLLLHAFRWTEKQTIKLEVDQYFIKAHYITSENGLSCSIYIFLMFDTIIMTTDRIFYDEIFDGVEFISLKYRSGSIFKTFS